MESGTTTTAVRAQGNLLFTAKKCGPVLVNLARPLTKNPAPGPFIPSTARLATASRTRGSLALFFDLLPAASRIYRVSFRRDLHVTMPSVAEVGAVIAMVTAPSASRICRSFSGIKFSPPKPYSYFESASGSQSEW